MTVTPISTAKAKSLQIADAKASIRHVFIHDMLLECLIGVYRHEHENKQKVRINLDLAVIEGKAQVSDDLGQVVCYEEIAEKVRTFAAQGHINLVETFAESIAKICLMDARVRSVRVRVEKLEALADAESVGVEIERTRV
ncbi:MAG: dihydroneopterin aldolase [Rhodospirillales bacterium]|jgi:dihydroneopterin aldolase